MPSVPDLNNFVLGPLNDWRTLRESAKVGLREAARAIKKSPALISWLESGLADSREYAPAPVAVELARLYKTQVVLARWFADTYCADDFVETRFIFDPDHGFEFEYFDPGDPGEYEWTTIGDVSDVVKQGFYMALCKMPRTRKEATNSTPIYLRLEVIRREDGR